MNPVRAFSILVAACTAASPVSACEEAPVAPALPNDGGCAALLQRVQRLDKLAELACVAPRDMPMVRARVGARVDTTDHAPPAPPPPAPNEPDVALCALVDPDAAIDACLVDAVTIEALRSDPRCPRFAEQIAIGDLAFFVLSRRHADLWSRVVPVEVRDAVDFQRWVGAPGNRAALAARVRAELQAP